MQQRQTLSPLLIAAKQPNNEIWKDLLKHGADVNKADREGNTPLLFCNNLTLAWQLLEKGASVKAENNRGVSPFIMAVKQANIEM